ncbi:hypothetical protein GCM10020218_103790 [Dactylosporangium vinaceum]
MPCGSGEKPPGPHALRCITTAQFGEIVPEYKAIICPPAVILANKAVCKLILSVIVMGGANPLYSNAMLTIVFSPTHNISLLKGSKKTDICGKENESGIIMIVKISMTESAQW